MRACFASEARVVLTCALVALSLLGSLAALGQQNADLDALQATLAKWVDAKKLISEEKQKARAQEELLQSRIELLELRLKDVAERSAEIREDDAEAGDKTSSLNQEEAKLNEALSLMKDRIAALEKRTLTLLRRAPEPLRKKLEALAQQCPKDPDKTDLSLSVRYQNVIGILNSMNSFNNEVTLSTEVRQLGPDKRVEVRVLYLGLAQAFFCNKDATVGGTGTPGDDTWVWTREDPVAPAVASMIAQYLNERSAQYEPVPVTITK